MLRFPLHRCAALAFAWIALICASSASHAQKADWDIRVTPFNQVFPALDLSQASRARAQSGDGGAEVLGDGNGLIAVRLTAQHDNEPVRIAIASEPWLAAASRFEAVLPRAGRTYELRPSLDWNASRLAAQTLPIAATLDFSLQRDGRAAQTRAVAISLRPLNEALYFVRDGADTVDLSWIFAAFVNENDAVVDRMLDAGRQSGIVDNFSGYADATPEQALRQAWAVWDALTARGIRYSGADPGVDRGPHVFSQHVRFLADTWNDRSANCIDGSALLASALQRIGLRSFLVLVPGHALVGFYTDASARRAVYLETTLLGEHIALPSERPAYADDIELSAATRSSLASFDAALHAGAARHARVAAKLDGRYRPDYAVIDIAAARGFGIRPITIAPTTTPPAAGGR